MPVEHAAPREVAPGRARYGGMEILHRHRHDEAFAAVVLAGGYVEAGDTGRHRVAAGDVIVHRAFESHKDEFDLRGAEVLVLPLPDLWTGPAVARTSNVDLIALAAERDLAEATSLLDEAPAVHPPVVADWPDLLALDLIANPDLLLTEWAETRGLHRASISRGFRKVFSVTPATFRKTARTLKAIRAIEHSGDPLSDIAVSSGFADQCHMTRDIKLLTGLTPNECRNQRLANDVR